MVLKNKNPNLQSKLWLADMDEVGFILTNIRPNGAISILPLGGILGEVVVSQMEIQTLTGYSWNRWCHHIYDKVNQLTLMIYI